MTPNVSVIIPTYNRAEYLPRAILSVLKQTYQDFELIIVDDGSTDDTGAVVSELFGSDPRICYVPKNVNKGGSAARNAGIERAAGKYIAFLDSDDEWFKSKLQKQVEFLESGQPGPVVLYSRYIVKEGNLMRRDRVKPRRGMLYRYFLAGYSLSMTSCCMVPAEVFKRVGGFDESLTSMQDQDMWIRLSEHYPFDFLEEYLAVVHSDIPARVSSEVPGRTRGIELYLTKWQETIEREVGPGAVESIRSNLQTAMYSRALMESLFNRNLADTRDHLSSLRDLDRLSFGILARMLLAIPGRGFFNACKTLYLRARQPFS